MSSHALLPRIATALSWTVFVASAALLALLSVDAFTPGLGARLEGGLYNRLQLPVCILYLLYFFVSMAASGQAGAYIRTRFPMLLISIPYVWLLGLFDIHTQGAVAYVLHFMPSFRAVLALTLVTRFISMSRLTGLFVSYAIILTLAIYFSSIIFYLHEGGGHQPGRNRLSHRPVVVPHAGHHARRVVLRRHRSGKGRGHGGVGDGNGHVAPLHSPPHTGHPKDSDSKKQQKSKKIYCRLNHFRAGAFY